MKNKAAKLTAAALLASGAFVASGWHFFTLTVRRGKGTGKKPPEKKTPGRKRFQLPQARINHPRYAFEAEYEAGKDWCREQTVRPCRITSVDGLRLRGVYLPAEDPARIVLLSHGYRGSTFGNFANLARFLHENHCDLLFVDQRCCGESEGKYITFGAREQYDIQDWAYFLDDRNAGGLPIYLFGMSMGATAALMAAGRPLPERVRGVIADCGFCSMKNQLQDMAAGWFRLRWIGLTLLKERILCRAVASFDMEEADVGRTTETARLPALFFHGLKDTYVLPQNSITNYQRYRGPKELVLVPGARHLCANYQDPELYRGKLLEFFRRCDGGTEPAQS